jgi:hypothetical protein
MTYIKRIKTSIDDRYIYLASTVLFPRKKILNIDKYFVCESRDMSDESGTYIILFKLKIILFTWR